MEYQLSGAAPSSAPAESSPEPQLPGYLTDTYRWAYLRSRNVRWLDRESVVQTILWYQHRRLAQAVYDAVEPGQNVLQAACVYGNFSNGLARRVGTDGSLQIVDVADVQVQNCRRKLAAFEQVQVRHENVIHIKDRNIDTACCYFLLHELPEDYKHGVVDALLRCVRPGGKVIFVDYHKPHWAHPVKPITSIVFDTLEPYAKDLWHRQIEDYAADQAGFVWQKKTCFGGLYQRVIATRSGSSD